MRIADKIKGGGIDPTYYDKIAAAESGNNPKAKNPNSSAAGQWQFVEGTWQSLNKKYNLGYTLEDRFDPVKSRKVAELFTKENNDYLKNSLGINPSNTDLYFAHFLGAAGAERFLKNYYSDPNQSVKGIATPAEIKYNKNIFVKKDGSFRTVGEVYDLMGSKLKETPQQRQQVTTGNTNFEKTIPYPTFAYETAQLQSAPEATPKQDKEVEQAEQVLVQKQNEESFLQKVAESEQMLTQQQSEPQPQQEVQAPAFGTQILQPYQRIEQFLAQEQMQKGGRVQIKDERQQAITIKDNTETPKIKIDFNEIRNHIEDQEELKRTGVLVKPRSEVTSYRLNDAAKTNEGDNKKFFEYAKNNLSEKQYIELVQEHYNRDNPTINIGKENKGLPFSNSLNYNPVTNEINLNDKSVEGFYTASPDALRAYISELAHAGQEDVAMRFLMNDLPAYIKMQLSGNGDMYNNPNSPYLTEGTIENYTHSTVEPQILRNIDYSPPRQFGAKRQHQQGGTITGEKFSEILKYLSRKQQGDVIEDNRGQWAHPGKVTKINSGDITMRGVSYPILGVDNLGNKKIMFPNQNYKFEGSSVTEYPLI